MVMPDEIELWPGKTLEIKWAIFGGRDGLKTGAALECPVHPGRLKKYQFIASL